MKPLLHDNDRILFWKGVYGIRNPFAENYLVTYSKPRRWDVVVFTSKGISGISEKYEGKDFIKRVIGLPGEHVQILDGEVLINGETLQKPKALGHLKYYREVVDEYPFVDVVSRSIRAIRDWGKSRRSSLSTFWVPIPAKRKESLLQAGQVSGNEEILPQ